MKVVVDWSPTMQRLDSEVEKLRLRDRPCPNRWSHTWTMHACVRASSLLVRSTQRSLALCAALRRAGQPASRFAARTARTGRRFPSLCTWYVTVRAYVQVRRTVASVPLARRSSIHTNKASSLAVAGCSSDPARPAPRTLPCPARRVAWPSSLLTAGPPLRSSPPIL